MKNDYLNNIENAASELFKLGEEAQQLASLIKSDRIIPNRKRRLLQPVTQKEYNAKRNAPCPCGSGLKFKKCHG